MNKMKRITAIAILALLSLGTTTQIFAQPYCGWDSWMENAGDSWWNRNIAVEQSLSQEQILELNKIRSTYEADIQPLERNLMSLRSEYNELNSSLEPDMKKVKKVWNKMRSLRDKIEDLQLESRASISKLMTDEQKTMLNEGGFGWWDYGSDWWCAYDGRDGIRNGRGMERKMRSDYNTINTWRTCW